MAGCQSASLEAAAPSGALPQPVVAADAPSAAATPAVTAAPLAAVPSDTQSVATAQNNTQAANQSPALTVERRNPGFVSIVPIERTSEPERADFVASGARNSGQFPNVGVTPGAAIHQMSAAEKYEQEARMLEILRNRENNPVTRASYDRRVAELRRLVRTHAKEVERQIEN